MQHELPNLPYANDALEPHISAETIEFHYGKHHATYVAKLNGMLAGTEFESATLEEMIMGASGGIFNNAAQIWNHSFYWNCLSPNGGGAPAAGLGEAIDRDFGSFEAFKDQFAASAVGNFGSGWTWLVKNSTGNLEIVNTDDAENPMKQGHLPLLTCDVWEHAYYIDYRNKRPDYIAAFWQLVNWEFVAANYAS
jgi:Fe-Mn family superoxide dismutase